jgi:CheY-like chemotaxis protein
VTELVLAHAGYVLIVDDDALTCDTLMELVEMAGCSAIAASNGREALSVLGGRRPCLVILDLMMPVMTGDELLRSMRADPTLADIPVVVATSTPQQAPPGVPIVPKPINVASLVTWVQRACACEAS